MPPDPAIAPDTIKVGDSVVLFRLQKGAESLGVTPEALRATLYSMQIPLVAIGCNRYYNHLMLELALFAASFVGQSGIAVAGAEYESPLEPQLPQGLPKGWEKSRTFHAALKTYLRIASARIRIIREAIHGLANTPDKDMRRPRLPVVRGPRVAKVKSEEKLVP